MSYKPSKNVLLLGIVSLFNDLSSEMVFSVFPAFFISVLKSGASSLGLVDGLAEGASNIIKIYSGRFSDAMQKRKPFITDFSKLVKETFIKNFLYSNIFMII